jgi:hypothetical protein
MERPGFQTSSYYEAARQQAWQQPEIQPKPEPAHQEPEAPSSYAQAFYPSAPPSYAPAPAASVKPIPVVVEHIPPPAPEPEAAHDSAAPNSSVFDDEFFTQPKPEVTENQWPEARIPSFAGYAPESETGDSDELDIPAFLRRSR